MAVLRDTAGGILRDTAGLALHDSVDTSVTGAVSSVLALTSQAASGALQFAGDVVQSGQPAMQTLASLLSFVGTASQSVSEAQQGAAGEIVVSLVAGDIDQAAQAPQNAIEGQLEVAGALVQVGPAPHQTISATLPLLLIDAVQLQALIDSGRSVPVINLHVPMAEVE